MLFNRVRFCLAKGKLIREVECAVCKIPPAKRYDRRLGERRSGADSAERELRNKKNNRNRRYPLCPGFFRMAILKIFYPLFKTSSAGVLITLSIFAAVIIIATGYFKPHRETKKPAPQNLSSEDIQKNFGNFAGQEDVPGDVIDSIFMDSFDFYFNGANVLFENYFYVADDQLGQLIRRLELLLFDTENLFSDWEKVSSRMPDYASNHVHIVRVRKIKKSLDLFRGNIIKLKSGNILKETLSIPSSEEKS